MTWPRRVLGSLSPRAILVIGWLGLVLYAYPGFMSYDSVLQLVEARAGEFSGGHPPMMGVLWSITDTVIGGPFGMLVIQTTCLLGGAYLLLRTAMTARAAAVCATLLLWFPPVSAVMAVIWKDAQMAGFLVLGTALLTSPRRALRVAGLGLLVVATGMRHNALAITLPLVVLLFAWSPAHRWWQRYPLALAAWVVVTLAANLTSAGLTTAAEAPQLWHDALARLDLVGTLRYAPDLDDAQLRDDLAGAPLRVTTGIQHAARSTLGTDGIADRKLMSFGTGSYVPALWVTTHQVIAEPTTAAERGAIARAWRRIVLGHPTAYLAYRWHVFRELIHLDDRDLPSSAYVWFTDVLDLSASARALGHAARPSKLQDQLRPAMTWLGSTWLFRPYVYLVVSLALLGLCLRHRVLLAIVLSGIANEAALFFLAPTIDFRYSFWLVIATALVVMILIARRIQPCPTATVPPPSRE